MSHLDKEIFGGAVLSGTYDLDVISPFNEQAALRSVVADVDSLLALNDPETQQRRHDHFKISGTTEDSYREGVFELEPSRPLLAGIRHVGGDRELPFVNVTLGFELADRDIPKISNLIAREFRPFQPKHFAVWLRPGSERNLPKEKSTAANRYLARRIGDLDLASNASNSIELLPIEIESCFAWYENEYQKFHSANPDLKSWVTASEREDLEKHESQGLLYGAYLGQELVGMIGGESQELLGLRGLYMGELLVGESHKGKGFATEMQRQFIRRFRDSFELVWGTIDARNIPSTKTAMRVGRRLLRTEYFVRLE
jgi:RimJ/RimL family protein N-acetyltransferase